MLFSSYSKHSHSIYLIRYIIRDTDSRTQRKREACYRGMDRVEEACVHSIRDHSSHCHPMNGGMWGGTKGAIQVRHLLRNLCLNNDPHPPFVLDFSTHDQDMKGLMEAWSNKGEYFQDMAFLTDVVWSLVQDRQLSHDAYCCTQFPYTVPFPTKRYSNYQHVGQVFDHDNQPRMTDVDLI